jgi:hypothetical protein
MKGLLFGASQMAKRRANAQEFHRQDSADPRSGLSLPGKGPSLIPVFVGNQSDQQAM